MPRKTEPCGELLQGKDGDETIIILSGNVPLIILQKIFSNYFQLETPPPWDNTWILFPGQLCLDGCDLRSFALDMRASNIDINIPPRLPPNTPTLQEVFGV